MLNAEEIEQINLISWTSTKPDLWAYVIHIANQRQCTQIQGRKLKRMGVKKGVPDLFIAIPRNGCHGLWIELKAGSNRTTTEQNEFIDLLNKQGYKAVIAYGYKEARQVIEEYMGYV